MTPPTDEELLDAVRAGDDEAVRALLVRHAPAVFRFGMKMCRDRRDAEDVLQETLLAAARGLRDVRGASSLTTWLYTVARSFCVKKRRRSKHAPAEIVPLDEPLGDRIAAREALPDETAERHELAAALDEAIATLDDKDREVLVLRDVEGLSAAEVAEVLGVGVAAVKSRLHRARAAVRARLVPLLGEAAPAHPSAPPCPDVAAMLSRYLEGDIGPEACDAMARHVATCTSCDAECASLRRTVGLCREAGAGELPKDVQARVRRALEAVVRAAPVT